MSWSFIEENNVKITNSMLTMLVFLSSDTKFRILYTLKFFWKKKYFLYFCPQKQALKLIIQVDYIALRNYI